jgi:hypothetical protein
MKHPAGHGLEETFLNARGVDGALRRLREDALGGFKVGDDDGAALVAAVQQRVRPARVARCEDAHGPRVEAHEGELPAELGERLRAERLVHVAYQLGLVAPAADQRAGSLQRRLVSAAQRVARAPLRREQAPREVVHVREMPAKRDDDLVVRERLDRGAHGDGDAAAVRARGRRLELQSGQRVVQRGVGLGAGRHAVRVHAERLCRAEKTRASEGHGRTR